MCKSFISGMSKDTKSDCRVIFIPKDNGGTVIEVKSSVKTFFGNSIYELAKKTLIELDVDNCKLKIEDFGALPYVLQARIESSVKTAYPELNKTSLPELKDYSHSIPDRNRFRITRLYIPGNQPKLMINAGLYKPDGVILDLEDSVAPDEKLSARLIVRNALRTLKLYGAEKMVRINQGNLGLLDLEEIIPENVNLILIPKVETAEQLKALDNKIDEISRKYNRQEPLYLMPIIESARGILNALAIAEASDKNVALAIGLEDYTADIGVQRTEKGIESLFARSMVINAAKAAGIQAIDTVYSDVANDIGLLESSIDSKQLGFDGKGCIHPWQIKIVKKGFAPSENEVEYAKKIIIAFEIADSKGVGVVSLGTKMIDPPVVKRALYTLKQALELGLISTNWRDEI
ncbi:MAG TPA: aldolase/citrate lyase family protein [Victivallales bacterium]|nr:aldolase/citrate lyase family protein [Victivallales bacterium]